MACPIKQQVTWLGNRPA